MQKQIDCPNCDTKVYSADININGMVAKCGNCNHIFSFEQHLPSLDYKREVFIIPPGIEAYGLLSEYNIELKWRNANSSALTFFTIFWNASLLPFLIIAFTTGTYAIIPFISVHLLVGVSLIYTTLARMINKTYITVDNDRLTIEHRPLKVPTYLDRNIPSDQISQVYVYRYVNGRTNGRPNYSFGLNAVLKNDEYVKLLKGMKKAQQGRYIEQQIEKFLTIEDVAIEGEWKGE